MGIQFIWYETYSVGNDVIDKQHKGMFELGSSLDTVSDVAEVKKIIMKLYRYTREHFNDEETMMRDVGYPELAGHKKQHDDLIDALNTIAEKSFSFESEVYEFRAFVYTWLIDHIMHYDKLYAGYVKGWVRTVTK